MHVLVCVTWITKRRHVRCEQFVVDGGVTVPRKTTLTPLAESPLAGIVRASSFLDALIGPNRKARLLKNDRVDQPGHVPVWRLEDDNELPNGNTLGGVTRLATMVVYT